MSWKRWLLLAGLLAATHRLEAGGNVTGTINSVAYFSPGSEQYLFFAPADTSRSQVKVSVLAGFSASANVIAAQYRFVARLLDADGNPVSLKGADGLPTLVLAFPPFPVSLAAGTGAPRPDTLSLSIADGVRLNAYSPYRVELTLQYLAGATWTAEGPVRASSNRRFFHFINQTSGDTPYNVISEILSVEWKRTAAIDSASGERHWLEAEIGYRLHRYDNFAVATGAPVPTDPIPVQFAFVVRTGGGANIPAAVDGSGASPSAASYVDGAVRTPWASDVQVLRVRFHPNAQLPSGTEPDFRAVASITHLEIHSPSDVYVSGNTGESDPATVLHFTGRLDWGGITTTLQDFSNDPTVGLVRRATDVLANLQNLTATVPGVVLTTFTPDALVQVSLDDAGTARVVSGNASVTLATTERTLHGIRYRVPGPIHLSPSGADADVELRLPAGMGVGKPDFALKSRLTRHVTAFNSIFEPLGTNSFPVPADERVVLDTRPLFFETTELKWLPFSGELQFNATDVEYVRREAFAALDDATDLPPDQLSKPSNERYYQFVAGTAGALNVRVGTDGRTALDARFTVAGGQFVAHFPLGVTAAWSSGQLTLQHDLPVVASSGLVPINPTTVAYEQGCPDGGCAGQTAELACDLTQLYFTPDGGLVGEGMAAASAGSLNSLRWGRNPGREVMAHEVGPFQKAAFAMSGHVLLGGVLPSADIANGVGVLLESGAVISPAATPSGVRMIRPGTPDYASGAGQYAGLNLHRAVETDPASVFGIARLGDTESSANFPLSSRARYYARRAGVSGLHEASAGGFLRTLDIYRYPFDFKTYGLSFLANENVDSATRCEIKLPAPVDDRFTFDKLTFTCVGAPDKATIAAGQSERTFRYWSAKIDAQGVEFAPRDRTATCDASQQRFLGVGAVVHGAGILESLAGTLYLSPEGDIITPADTERPEGVSFYLGAGATVSVAGAMESTTRLPVSYYPLTVGKAYFNEPPSFLRTETGHGRLNLFGDLKLPFYGKTPVHLMTLATKNPSPDNPASPSDLETDYDIQGGWIAGGVPAADPTGDLNHLGVPPGLSREEYLANPDYAPYARGEFLDVINLGFPLKWFSSLREFSGVTPAESSLLLIQTFRELHKLSATDIGISVGAAYTGFPRLHLTTEEIGLVGAVEDLGAAVTEAIGGGLAADARSGFSSMRTIAGGRVAGQVRTLASLLVARVAPDLRTAMQGACPGGECNPAALEDDINTVFDRLVLDARALLLAEDFAEPGLRAALVSQLTTAANSLRSFYDPVTGMFIRDEHGSRTRLAAVVREILIRGGLGSTLASLPADALAPLLRPFEEDLNRTAAIMFHVADRLEGLRARYASDDADLYLELRALFADPASVAELNGLINQARLDLIAQASEPHWVEENVSGPGDAFGRQLTADVGNRLVSSEFYTRLDRTFKYHLRSIEESGVSAVDGVLALLQRMINKVGRIALAAADEVLENTLINPWDDFLGFGNIDGYFLFSGDEVRRARVSGKGGVDFGEEFKFQTGVNFEINVLDSEGEGSCATASPATTTECRMEFFTDQSSDTTTSTPVPTDAELYGTLPLIETWEETAPDYVGPTEDERFRSSESFRVQLKATFESDTGALTGLGGGFAWATKRNFGAVQVARVAGACMFSRTENYVAGSIEARFGGDSGAQLQGGLFLGRTCTLEPLRLINPHLVRVLEAVPPPGEPPVVRPFTGFYVYARGWMPLVSAGCLFNLSAGAGVGLYVDFESDRAGMSLLLGVRGELLCVLAATGELEGTLGSDRSALVFDARGTVNLRLGICPFCVEFGKTLHVTYNSRTDSWE